MSESDQADDFADLTEAEVFALIEGLADAADVAHAIGHDDHVEDALESIQSIAADHYDDAEVEQTWEDW